jgi:tetratricopeptide (TPR) repeat protein
VINGAFARFNKQNQSPEGLECMEKAFSLDASDARVLMELDQLYKKLGHSHEQRLRMLDRYPDLVEARDDLYLERITLLNQLARYEEARQMISRRTVHPWEGGEGKVPAQYQIAHLELAKQCLLRQEYEPALQLLQACLEYPHHLGEGKLHGAQENDFYYFMGCALQGMGKTEQARECFLKASSGLSEPAPAIFYNDQKPDTIFYQGCALLKLGRAEEAGGRFRKLIAYGEEHLNDHVLIDYFAVSLPDLLIWEDDLDVRNVVHCQYLMGLGCLGLGDRERALAHFEKARKLDVNHQGILQHIFMAQNPL